MQGPQSESAAIIESANLPGQWKYAHRQQLEKRCISPTVSQSASVSAHGAVPSQGRAFSDCRSSVLRTGVIALVAKGLTVVGLRLMDSVFGFLLLTAEPRTGGGATGGEDYGVVGIENLDC
jgi:hypothetical protein